MKKLFKKFLSSKIGLEALAFLGVLYIRFVYYTSRWQFIHKDIIEDYIKNKKPFIICFWHGRLAMLPCAWQWKGPFQMLLSEHRDGRLIANVLKHFKISIAYGSTTRGGAKAALELVKSMLSGIAIGITPDGPKGPAYKVSPGIITLSKLAKADIIPVSYATSKRKTLRTWDKFLLPLPFGKGLYIAGDPISYPKENTDKESCQKILEDSLNSITEKADQLIGFKSLPPDIFF